MVVTTLTPQQVKQYWNMADNEERQELINEQAKTGISIHDQIETILYYDILDCND